MNKMKIINNILNAILFLLVIKVICWYFHNEGPPIYSWFSNFGFMEIPSMMTVEAYFKVNVLYAISKKFNFIAFLEKHNFFVKFLLVFLVDLIILYMPAHVEMPEGLVTAKFSYETAFLFGVGYMNSFLRFTFAKFLARKFPQKFSWFRYLYFFRIEKLPNLVFNILLFSANLYFCYCSIQDQIKYHPARIFEEHFYIVPALIAFIYAIKIIYDIVLIIKAKIAAKK